MTNDDLTEYRIGQLEDSMEVLSSGVADLRDFSLSIRVWVKMIAIGWSIGQVMIISLLTKYLVG